MPSDLLLASQRSGGTMIAGSASVQAVATTPASTPRAFPISFSNSTSLKFRDSFGSLKLGLRLLQSSAGRLAMRSTVIAPVNSPEAIGE